MRTTVMPAQSKKDKLYDFDIPIVQNRDDEDKITFGGKTNQTTLDFVNNRYVVLRDFIPKDIINMTLDAWRTIELDENAYNAHFMKEDELTHSTPEAQRNKSHGAYNFPPAVGIHRWIKNALNPVLDLKLQETYSFTRKYVRGASLSSHTDRPSCEISVTFPLRYKTDDNTPWKIWLNNEHNFCNYNYTSGQQWIKTITQDTHNGISLELEVGDVLLYQGPNVPHWRNTLCGDYSYHMFVHFINTRSKLNHVPGYTYRKKGTLPHSINYVTEWDGRLNRWSDEPIEGEHSLDNWCTKVWDNVPDKHLYVNNYSYLTGKVEEDLI